MGMFSLSGMMDNNRSGGERVTPREDQVLYSEKGARVPVYWKREYRSKTPTAISPLEMPTTSLQLNNNNPWNPTKSITRCSAGTYTANPTCPIHIAIGNSPSAGIQNPDTTAATSSSPILTIP
ncbi:hypothetical protein PAAG_04989 [Paracoccidioides lutzii Pb01]|uniref:Uncharacterized protein n=1 Tax=Paracoccidioides lutzii (strain ATCC MYA-826 / Pb01) TaxID=502779 RepID=C1H2J6_PARBA|nr:hypothetical protein PAAG_04989 [Paracoccidioides lutzii Pb01]EEH33940.2 hypothetical protein PAAG_04989 [Paracoccidioides lutzii Pb01]